MITPAALAEAAYEFNLPQQALADALRAVGRQTTMNILFEPEAVENMTAPALRGRLSMTEAVHRLLAGTKLAAEQTAVNSLLIRPVNQKATNSNSALLLLSVHETAASEVTEGESPGWFRRLRLAQNDQTSRTESFSSEEQETSENSSQSSRKRIELEEIVVTGTHIRGVQSAASKVFIYEREYLDKSGFTTAQQFIQSLPQNFQGGASEDAGAQASARNGNDLNVNKGAGINLRGLGNDSTLVLLNGRRIAAGGFGDFVDITLIPLSAIERIEVLPDGASAIYGSDAVGGVVNFVLRKDYQGAESRLLYGNVTDGSREELQLSQMVGSDWSSGHLLASYEYYSRGNLDARDRDYAADLTLGGTVLNDLLPSLDRQSLFVSAEQEVSGSVQIFGTANYARRKSHGSQFNTVLLSQHMDDHEVEQFGGLVGATLRLPGSWQLEIVGNYNESESRKISQSNTLLSFDNANDTVAWTTDVKADGAVLHLPGGEVRVALGGQFRSEDLTIRRNAILSRGVLAPILGNREVSAVFGEALIPLVGAPNRLPGIERLELSLAARYEDYSDFGGSFDPKVGLLWSVFDGLNLRTTWGTSFKAPLLFELDTSFLQGLLIALPDLISPTGTSIALGAFTSSVPNLQPEQADTWTVGLDFQPRQLPDLKLSLTYFNIDFRERIQSYPFSGVLGNPIFAAFESRPPNPELVALIRALPPGFFFNLTGSDLDDAEVSFDTRLRNIAATRVSGLDVTVDYGLDAGRGRMVFGLNANYLLEFRDRVTDRAPADDKLNRVYNPVDLRLRGSVGWNQGGWAVTTFVNYTDRYRNDLTAPQSDITSWVTLDLNVRYRTSEQSRYWLLDDTTFYLNASNLLDRDPPRIVDIGSFGNAGYDAQNAEPLGRFLSFGIVKSW